MSTRDVIPRMFCFRNVISCSRLGMADPFISTVQRKPFVALAKPPREPGMLMWGRIIFEEVDSKSEVHVHIQRLT